MEPVEIDAPRYHDFESTEDSENLGDRWFESRAEKIQKQDDNERSRSPRKKLRLNQDNHTDNIIKQKKEETASKREGTRLQTEATRPMGHGGVPFIPKPGHSLTVPKPFIELEERCKKMLTKKQEKIQKFYEEEKKARRFQATLLPPDEPDDLGPRPVIPLTAPEPFHFKTECRVLRSQSRKIEEEAKAQPKGKGASRVVRVWNETDLNTNARALERKHFNEHIKAREAQVLALKRQVEDQHQQEEKEAVARLRKDMVPKATRVHKYKAVEVHASDKPLTLPKTPKLLTSRISKRNLHE